MSEEYVVAIDNEETNEEACSITGRVNGQQCAVVLRNSSFLGLSGKEQKHVKLVALAKAYKEKAATVVSSAVGEMVKL